MRRTGILLAMTAIAILAASTAKAIDKPVVGHFSFGASIPQGKTSDAIKDGWAFHGGATWFSPNKPNLGLRLDFGIEWFDLTDQFLSHWDTTDPTVPPFVPPDDGWARSWSGTVDLEWDSKSSGKVGWYVIAGVGVYYDQAQLAQVGYGQGWYCDPWWGYCYPGIYEGYYDAGSASSWDWGLNAGGGITFHTGGATELYLEAVYHWIDTKNGAELLPISFGVRW